MGGANNMYTGCMVQEKTYALELMHLVLNLDLGSSIWVTLDSSAF